MNCYGRLSPSESSPEVLNLPPFIENHDFSCTLENITIIEETNIQTTVCVNWPERNESTAKTTDDHRESVRVNFSLNLNLHSLYIFRCSLFWIWPNAFFSLHVTSP
jgi:hypothetical protein